MTESIVARAGVRTRSARLLRIEGNPAPPVQRDPWHYDCNIDYCEELVAMAAEKLNGTSKTISTSTATPSDVAG